MLQEKIRNANVRKREQDVKFQYRRNVRNATDPYKRIVYCILGCCDVHDEHTEVAKTADDYLWLKLCLIRESEKAIRDEHLNYTDLQTTIIEEYGNEIFLR